jgi:DNA-binding LacI/PurR family transcriptional regulator
LEPSGRTAAIPAEFKKIIYQDPIAVTFKAIRDKELPVPNTIAFATFDESPWTTMIRPAITVIEQPTYAIGQTAAEMLLKRIADPNRPTRHVVLSHKLIIRQSCGCRKT